MMNLKKSSVELLSPCGSPETLEAALKGGADAVYLGGTVFNARMNAKNFNDEDIENAVDKCHANGVRLYVTLNTLLYDKEFNEAINYALKLYNIGVDAFIVADIGFAAALKHYIPDIELHASTQMSGHNTQAAVKLSEIGFKRMVCARELNIDDIRYLADHSPIEIEMFVHGAHCVSVSGQCLMSSFIGGRSGNRGECAQPCRMKYNDGYPLSLKDMCLAGHITEIIDSGVKSLKIEGRMKSPDYVYTVTSTYRQLLNEHRNAKRDEIDNLSRVFSRSGFTDGYFTGKINNSMLGIRTETNKTDSRNVKIEYTQIERKSAPGEIETVKRDLKILITKSVKVVDKTHRIKSARFQSASQIPENHNFDIVYLPYDKYDPIANGVILPTVIKDNESIKINDNAKHVLIGNIGHIGYRDEKIIHGDFRLNVFNSESMKYYSDIFDDVILSPELTLPQIRDIGGNKCVIVYGKIPVMTLERKIDVPHLKDRMNAVFPLFSEGERDIVYNSVPVYMADKKIDMRKSGIVNTHFIFTDESKNDIKKIIEMYDKGLPYDKNFRRIK